MRTTSQLRENARRRQSVNTETQTMQRRLLDAHANVVTYLYGFIQERAYITLSRNPESTEFRLFNPLEGIEHVQLKGFKPSTVLVGFWDKATNSFHRTSHEENGVTETPMQELNRLLSPLGYTITDVSDGEMSKRTVWRITLA